jgi:hypothetical protein
MGQTDQRAGDIKATRAVVTWASLAGMFFAVVIASNGLVNRSWNAHQTAVGFAVISVPFALAILAFHMPHVRVASLWMLILAVLIATPIAFFLVFSGIGIFIGAIILVYLWAIAQVIRYRG